MRTTRYTLQQAQSYTVIIRAIWTRGCEQRDALAELERRGLWLTEEQRRQAERA